MADKPPQSRPDPQEPDDFFSEGPPKPEQIWPPPMAKPAPPEEKPVDLTWSDEVEKIDEAIEEIRKINGNGGEDTDMELAVDIPDEPLVLDEAVISRATAPAGPSAPIAGRVRPQSENEIAQLWSNVFFSSAHSSPKVVVVTSARRGDGATQIAAALAMVGADANDELQVCLVDFNLRHASIGPFLGLKGAKGVSDVLNGAMDADEAIQTLSFKSGRKLSVIPAGGKAAHPLSLIKSRQAKALLGRLRDRFDHVIVDVASANVYPDAQILGAFADGALLVVRAGDTPRETVAEAKKRLDMSGVRCLGLVMNQRSDPIPGLLYQMT